MAKMKVKFDMSSVKQYLFEKGEKVGLIACTAIMVLVVAYALYSGFSARGTDKGQDWDKALVQESERLKRAIDNAAPSTDDKVSVLDPGSFTWPQKPYSSRFVSLFPNPDTGGKKRINPLVYPILSGQDDKLFQMNYYLCGTYQWTIDPVGKKVSALSAVGEGKAAGGGGGMIGPVGPMGAGMGGQPQGGAGAGMNLAKSVRPTRYVVVSAIFPMRDQLEEFRQKLNFNSIGELLASRNDLPKPIGLEVARCEILPGGKATPWEPFITFDSKGKVDIKQRALREMMQRMIVDEDEQHAAAQYIFPGLVTPLPKIANPGTRYAKVDLKGFEVKQPALADGGVPQVPGGAMVGGKPGGNQFAPVMPNFGKGKGNPMGDMEGGGAAGAATGPEYKDVPLSWSKVSKELQLKFLEKYDLFDPLGLSASLNVADKKGGNLGGAAPAGIAMGGGKGGMGENTGPGIWGWDLHLSGMAGQGAGPMQDENMIDENVKPGVAATPGQINLDGALVRFFDPSVLPGKTYCYTIRVKMANPNYKKPNDVSYLALSEQKELQHLPTPSQGWVATPQITIPPDYHWYAVDQAPEVKINKGADFRNPPFGVETVPIQVHRWIEKAIDANGEYVSADWAIAERLHQRRGETLGRQRIMIELPIWKFSFQSWQIGDSVQAAVGKRRPAAKAAKNEGPIDAGLPIDLVTAPPSVIVDFAGGKKAYFEKQDRSRDYIPDTSAVDVLALAPDGKLVLRNSRIDSETDSGPGAERKDRYDHWRQRLEKLRTPSEAPAAAVPGVGVKPGGGR